MSKKTLLALSKYSNKYGVSLSTLRRRIKAGEVEFEFDQGKYWLKDEPIHKYLRNRLRATEAKPEMNPIKISNHVSSLSELEEAIKDVKSFTSSAKNMMSEVKQAFIKTLQEKEEQILELKEEVADLRTLSRVLDQENERLKKNLFPEWIENQKES